jgi:hypothetical protein
LADENEDSQQRVESSWSDEPVSLTNPIVRSSSGTYATRYRGARSFAVAYGNAADAEPSNDAGNNIGWNHMHPLQSSAASSPASLPLAGGSSPLHQQPTPTPPILNGITQQFQKRISLMQREDGPLSPKRRRRFQESILRLTLPIVLLVVANKFGLIPTSMFGGPRTWDRLGERHLGGRQCVMNLFVDKHEANEYNPDWDLATNSKKDPEPVKGTYRSKGQVEVINRFISAVAAAFRPNVLLQQHVVFAGTRDGGHLAQEALKHWPARGSYHTQLHVFSDETPNESLEYETLQGIEDLFGKYTAEVHIYDKNGNKAGQEEENDDDEVDSALKNRKPDEAKKFIELPNMKKLIFDEDDEDDSVIPYLHVDGTSMSNQMEILNKVMPLLQENLVVVVGLEHSPDMNVHQLIDFFHDLEYKTFMLGLRQLTRIDNLCPEILNNVLMHPSLASNKGWSLNPFGDHEESDIVPMMPPFFVAMPRGRHSKEEMSIQHMYDLFSGAAGLSQVKTANDRVATVK